MEFRREEQGERAFTQWEERSQSFWECSANPLKVLEYRRQSPLYPTLEQSYCFPANPHPSGCQGRLFTLWAAPKEQRGSMCPPAVTAEGGISMLQVTGRSALQSIPGAPAGTWPLANIPALTGLPKESMN